MNWERYTMIYNPKISTNELRILGKEFVKNNGNKGKLIINNKKYNLLEFNPINNFNADKLKINMVSSQNIFNRSYMFMKCKSLIELSIYVSYKDIETDSNNIFIEPEYFYLNNILLMELILFEEKTIQKMRLILSILLYQKKRMRSMINQRYQI